jgi:hypothetical protein
MMADIIAMHGRLWGRTKARVTVRLLARGERQSHESRSHGSGPRSTPTPHPVARGKHPVSRISDLYVYGNRLGFALRQHLDEASDLMHRFELDLMGFDRALVGDDPFMTQVFRLSRLKRGHRGIEGQAQPLP